MPEEKEQRVKSINSVKQKKVIMKKSNLNLAATVITIIRINMAINLDLEMKRQIGFDMLIIVVDFRHEFNKGNMETERWNI